MLTHPNTSGNKTHQKNRRFSVLHLGSATLFASQKRAPLKGHGPDGAGFKGLPPAAADPRAAAGGGKSAGVRNRATPASGFTSTISSFWV